MTVPNLRDITVNNESCNNNKKGHSYTPSLHQSCGSDQCPCRSLHSCLAIWISSTVVSEKNSRY